MWQPSRHDKWCTPSSRTDWFHSPLPHSHKHSAYHTEWLPHIIDVPRVNQKTQFPWLIILWPLTKITLTVINWNNGKFPSRKLHFNIICIFFFTCYPSRKLSHLKAEAILRSENAKIPISVMTLVEVFEICNLFPGAYMTGKKTASDTHPYPSRRRTGK